MSDPGGGQIQRRLLAVAEQLEAELQRQSQHHDRTELVLRALALAHPDRPKLLTTLRGLAALREEVDGGQVVSDEEIAERKAKIEAWCRWIEAAP